MTVKSKVFPITVGLITTLILIAYFYSGIRSSYRAYYIGYGNDMTSRWVGTNNYDRQRESTLILTKASTREQAYFGHSLPNLISLV